MDILLESYHAHTALGQQYTAKMHSHDKYEIYCFLSGKAQYCVEGRRYDLSPGDIVLMRKGEVHLAEVDACKDYERIGVHFDIDPKSPLPLMQLLAPFHERPAGKFNHYPARLFPDNHWEFYLKQLFARKGQETELCFLLPLLCELSEQFPKLLTSQEITAEKDIAAPIMKYINAHLTEELSLERLSRQFYTSQTHLNRLFRKSAGTTAWEYITVKRLFMAKELLSKGISATQVCTQCGFGDYSTFFRAYKRRFGVSPSAHSTK